MHIRIDLYNQDWHLTNSAGLQYSADSIENQGSFNSIAHTRKCFVAIPIKSMPTRDRTKTVALLLLIALTPQRSPEI